MTDFKFFLYDMKRCNMKVLLRNDYCSRLILFTNRSILAKDIYVSSVVSTVHAYSSETKVTYSMLVTMAICSVDIYTGCHGNLLVDGNMLVTMVM